MNVASSPGVMCPSITLRPPKNSIRPMATRKVKSMNAVLDARILSACMKYPTSFLVALVELRLFVFLGGECLDDPDAGEVLLEHRAHLGHLLLHDEPESAHSEPDYRGVDDDHGHKAGAYQSEPPVLDEQDCGDDNKQTHELRGADQTHVDEHSDIIHVRDGARHQGARVVAVMEPEAHVLHVVIQHISDVVGDELGNRFTQVGLEVGQHSPD